MSGAHSAPMMSMSRERKADAEHPRTLPELKPWREVGWIFRDGEVVAIERQDDTIRERRVDER